jgi:hypothetical protein
VFESRHVSFFSWLWRNSSKSTESWTTFVRITRFTMILIVDTNWSTTLIDNIVWIQIVIICSSSCGRSIDMMCLRSMVCLAKLVEDRSGSFCINCRYLSHHLSIICMRAVCGFGTGTLFGGTYLWWRSTLSTMGIIPIFTLTCLIWWWANSLRITLLAVLLIISNSVSSEHVSMELQTISITCV